MPDVLIRRCTLRVVRRGGWSWGGDPRRVLRGAVEALPALLAARLADLGWQGDEEIAEPVRLRVPVRLRELLAASGRSGSAGGAAELEARLARAVETALTVRPPRPAGAREEAATGPAPPPAPRPPQNAPDQILVLDRLLDWHRRGILLRLLASLPAGLPELLLARLLAPPATPAAEVSVGEAARHGERGMTTPLAQEGDLPPAARRLLRLAVAAAELGLGAGEAASAAALARLHAGEPATPVSHRPPPPHGPEESGTGDIQAAPVGPRRAAAPAGRQAPMAAPLQPLLRPRLDGEVRVASALPWLLLGPLSRTGYLGTLAAALRLADAEAAAPCFAVALAAKVLAPPERRWHRGAEVAATAAAFAGVAAPIPDAALSRFARRLQPFLDLADADLAQGTLAGREATDPLLLVAVAGDAGGGLLLLDPRGLFPVAWSEPGTAGAARLAAVLGAGAETASAAHLLVAARAAHPELLAGLDAAGLAFATPAPPARGEPWQRLPGARGRWWTNRPARRPPALGRWLRDFDDMTSRAEELGRELTVRRPAVPRAAVGALERSVTLAAASALGTLAWTLWHEREAADPLLALERFADLDGRVRFTRDTVHLRLPLGKRHRDLYQAGLLAPVRDVPWLGGRTVEITGG